MNDHGKMNDCKLSAAAARKRKQRQRKSPEELREEQLSNTTSRSTERTQKSGGKDSYVIQLLDQ
jgi:hypothetical protein